MTNPIPRFKVKIKTNRHKNWSVQFFTWAEAVDFAYEIWGDETKSVKVKRL